MPDTPNQNLHLHETHKGTRVQDKVGEVRAASRWLVEKVRAGEQHTIPFS